MKRSLRVLILLGLCILIPIGAYFWATGIFSTSYAYRSPLRNHPPQPGASLGEAPSGRVVIVLIDALRYDTSMNASVMPTLNRLRNEGASATMHSRPPSFSEPGYTTIMTGAWPEINDGPTFNLDYAEIPTWTQDNLFSAAHRAGLGTAISGYYWFEKLVPQQDVDESFYTPGEDAKADSDVMAAALPWLENGNASFVLIHLDQVDYAGHHLGGPKSASWNKAAAEVDSDLAEIAAKLDFSQDTLIVLSDHGQIDAGGHGGQEPVTLTEPFVMTGARVIPGKYPDIQMVDIAPTIAALLNLNLPAADQGQVLTGMIQLPESVLSILPGAIKQQQTHLVEDYASALGMTVDAVKMPTGSDVAQYQAYMASLRDARILSQEILRAALLALLLALIIDLLVRNAKNGSLWWIAAGLVFVALFNYRYGIWDGKTYSVSSINSESELILYVAITAGIAFLIAWLFDALGQRTFWKKPLDAASTTAGLTLTILFVAALPVFWSFLRNGVLTTWTLPDYLSNYLGLLGLLQIIAAGAFGLAAILLTSGISWLINQKTISRVKGTKK